VTRHASIENLAKLADGDLRPRKAARISKHVSGCALCTEHTRQLQAVPGLLASAQFPPMPEYLSARIEVAISAEASVRLAAEPASESRRRDLPVRNAPARRGRQLPGISSRTGLRLAAAAGAAVIVAGGGYELATHATSGPGSAAGSSGSVAGPEEAPLGAAPRVGPAVAYRHGGHTRSVSTVETYTNFQPGSFRSQTVAALASMPKVTGPAKVNGGLSVSHGTATSASPNATPAAGGALPAFAVPNLPQLSGCVSLIAGGRTVLFVDLAKYRGKFATVIVVGQDSAGPAEAFAVGPACSSTVRDILIHQDLPRL
jgi:hypothetical protein